MNDLRQRDQIKYEELKKTLAPGVIRDLRDIAEFGERHQGPWSSIFTRINDLFLKANSQSEGVQSYSKVVELLVAHHFRNQKI